MKLRIMRVHSAELREEVYALRYRAYRSVGALPESHCERFTDPYDVQPNHVLWALSANDRVIGSIRTTWYDPKASWQIPEIERYGDDILRVVPQGQRMLSGNRFVIDPDHGKSSASYAMLLLRHHMLVAQQRADWALAAVRSNHLPFYRRVLKLERVSEGRLYPGLNSVMYLTACDFSKNVERVYAHQPVVRPRGYERVLLDEAYRDLWEIGLPVEQ